MPTETTRAALQAHVLRLCAAVEQLNVRIAQLSDRLDLPLDQAQAIEHLLVRGAHSGDGPRQARLREELRGLVVLRYTVLSRYCREFGPGFTRELLLYTKEKMCDEGYRPGVDGIDVHAWSAA